MTQTLDLSKMYRCIFTLLALLVASTSNSQDYFCGADKLRSELLKDSVLKKELSEVEDNIYNYVSANGIGPNDTIITIPIVIHIIHKGESLGTGSNLSDDLIHEAVQGLNDRYSGKIGSSPDTKIRFCLAVRDPNGEFTSGINRVDGTVLSGYDSFGMAMFSGTKGAKEKDVKDLSKWPTTQYYNIWIVHNIVNFAGYAYFPGTTANPYDGAAIAARTVGYYSPILTHEVGHGLNLFHVFEQSYKSCPSYTNCSKMDDKVCDTPPSVDLGTGHCQPYSPCKSSYSWLNNRRNYMSYCINFDRFTNGQIDRMRKAIHSTIRDSLRYSLACVPPQANDAGITEFIICDSTVRVVLKNFGGNAITKVTVPFMVNDSVRLSYNWTGKLATYQTDTFVISNAIIKADSGKDLKCWTSLPNGFTDSFPMNDTSVLEAVFKPLKGGTYTVGSSSSNYKTISDMARALNLRGICGPVVFNILNGRYDEQIVLNKIRGSSSGNTITIQSLNGDRDSVHIRHKVVGANDNYIFHLNGTNYVSIKNITFSLSGHPYYSTVLRMNYAASNNIVSNCVFIGQAKALGSLSTGALVNIGESIDSSNVFRGNVFKNAAYGLYAKGVNSLGPGVVLDSNLFFGQRFMAVYLLHQNSPKIKRNTIIGSELMFNGLYLNSCINDIEIVGNVIRGNVVYCLEMYLCESGLENKGLIANNFFQSGAKLANSTLHNLGIKLNYCDRLRIIHNTISITAADTLSSAFHCSRTYNLEVYNNNLTNLGGGYAMYYDYADHKANDIDYNNSYSNGKFLAFHNSKIKSLQDWRIHSKKDVRSVSLDPLFVSDSSYQMCEPKLYGAGKYIPQVGEDIEGNPRKKPYPSIGALEQSFKHLDIGKDTTVCDSIVLKSNLENVKFLWSTGDSTPSITAEKEGTYTLRTQSSCHSQVDSVKISIETQPTLSLVTDTTLCKYDTFTVSNEFGSYLWNTGDSINRILIQDEGKFWLQVSNRCGTDSDTVYIYIDSTRRVYLGNDTMVCDSLVFELPLDNQYIWSDSSASNIFTAYSNGTYWVQVISQCGMSSDSINVQIEPEPEIDLGNDTIVCKEYTLNTNTMDYSFVWSTGDTSNWIFIDSSGTYSAKVTSRRKCVFQLDSVKVSIVPLPMPDLGPDTTMNKGDTIRLNTSVKYRSYLWSTGSDEDTLVLKPNNDSVMLVSVEVVDSNGCIGHDTMQIFLKEPVRLFKMNNGSGISIYPNPVTSQLHIQTRHMKKGLTAHVYNGNGQEVINQKMDTPHIEIKTDHLPPGQYTLQLKETQSQEIYTVKIVVAHQ